MADAFMWTFEKFINDILSKMEVINIGIGFCLATFAFIFQAIYLRTLLINLVSCWEYSFIQCFFQGC